MKVCVSPFYCIVIIYVYVFYPSTPKRNIWSVYIIFYSRYSGLHQTIIFTLANARRFNLSLIEG